MNEYLKIKIEGHRLAARFVHPCDTGIPVLFLHGIGGSLSFWTPELTSPFHHLGPCYSLSLPGHFPASFPKDFPADYLTAELIARLVASAIQNIVGDKKVLLVGHSTGGFAALSTSIYYPNIVAGVISIAGFAKGQWVGVLGFCQWLVRQGPAGRAIFKKIYKMGGLHPSIFRMYWQGYVNKHIALLNNQHFEAVANSMLPYFRKLDMEAMVTYFAGMPNIDITPCLSEISIPTCLLAGDQDPIVPSRQSHTIAQEIASARLTIIKGAGHLPFFERPREYQRAVDTWLTGFQSLCQGYPFSISS